MNPLKALQEFGQAPWLDYIRRSLLTSGELQRLIKEDELCGLTLNPAIFEKFTFGVVKAAQARGDFQVLAERGRRALRIHLGSDVKAGLARLAAVIEDALR